MIRNRNTGKTGGRLRAPARLAALLVLAVLLHGCSGGTSGGAGKPQGAAAEPVKNGKGQTVVTFSVLTKDRFLQEAETEFEKLNPGIDIEFREHSVTPDNGGRIMVKFGGEEDEGDLEKYITTVNTEMMSGKGADLIQVDKLPYKRYAEKGLLADLSELFEGAEGLDRSGYAESVLDALKTDGASYAVPLRYSLGLLMGDAEAIAQSGASADDAGWTWASFLETARKTAESSGKTAFAGLTPAGLLKEALRSDFSAYVNEEEKQAAFDTEEFRSLLERIKGLYDDGLASETAEAPDSGAFRMFNVRMAMDLLLMPNMLYGGKSKLMAPPASGGPRGWTFDSSLMAAVNASSPVKKEAMAFLRFLLGEDMQSRMSLLGIPVNRTAAAAQLDDMTEKLAGGGMKIMGKDGEAAAAPSFTEEDKTELLEALKSVGRYAGSDRTVLRIAAEEAEPFFAGRIDAAEAAKRIERKVNTYLNE